MSSSGPAQRAQPIAPMMRVLWARGARPHSHRVPPRRAHDLRARNHLAVLQHPGPDGQRPSAPGSSLGHEQTGDQPPGQPTSSWQATWSATPTPADRNATADPAHRTRPTAVREHRGRWPPPSRAEWAQQVGARRLEELRATLSDLLNRESAYLLAGCAWFLSTSNPHCRGVNELLRI